MLSTNSKRVGKAARAFWFWLCVSTTFWPFFPWLAIPSFSIKCVQKTGFLQWNEMLLPRVLWLTWDLIYRKPGLLRYHPCALGHALKKGLNAFFFKSRDFSRRDFYVQRCVSSRLQGPTNTVVVVLHRNFNIYFSFSDIYRSSWTIKR